MPKRTDRELLTTIRVDAGKRARTGLTVLATQDQIDRHQSLGYDAETCKIKVAMVVTYGTPQRQLSVSHLSLPETARWFSR